MSLSEQFVKLVGVILVLVGLLLILSAVGFPIFVALNFIAPIWSALLGVVLLSGGVVIIRGGNVTL